MAVAAPISRAPRLLDKLELDLLSVETGVSIETMTRFAAESGVALSDLYDIVIPARTLKHRRARNEALSTDESDKLARLVRVFDHAVRVFGDTEHARAWLSSPKKRFNSRSPLHMVRTEFGARLVDEMLGQIDNGLFA